MAGTRQYANISADGNSRQQNGDYYNTTTNHYHAPPTERQNLRLLDAALNSDLDRIKFLVESRGVDVDTEDEDGLTALHCAAWMGSEKCVGYLLSHGAYIHHRSDVYGSPLTLAAFRMHHHLFTGLFAQHGIKAGENAFLGGLLGSALHALALSLTPLALSFTPLGQTSFALDIFHALLRAGAPVNSIRKVDGAFAERLIRGIFPCRRKTRNDSTPNTSTCSPLHLAVEFPCFELVEALITSGADLRARKSYDLGTISLSGITPLMMACKISGRRGFCVCNFILDKDTFTLFDEDSDGCTALQWSACCGTHECLEAMINRLSTLNVRLTDPIVKQDRFGRTALMRAARRGHVKCVKILLRHDRHSDYQSRVDRNGITALEHAVKHGHTECADAIENDSFR